MTVLYIMYYNYKTPHSYPQEWWVREVREVREVVHNFPFTGIGSGLGDA
jgi:hypothetical protein